MHLTSHFETIKVFRLIFEVSHGTACFVIVMNMYIYVYLKTGEWSMFEGAHNYEDDNATVKTVRNFVL